LEAAVVKAPGVLRLLLQNLMATDLLGEKSLSVFHGHHLALHPAISFVGSFDCVPEPDGHQWMPVLEVLAPPVKDAVGIRSKKGVVGLPPVQTCHPGQDLHTVELYWKV
jgi:hypothetical protein